MEVISHIMAPTTDKNTPTVDAVPVAKLARRTNKTSMIVQIPMKIAGHRQ
jgi:hypothetical protein